MDRFLWMSLVAAACLLGWILSIGDPCLLGVLGGASPPSNPIAITTCSYDPEGGVLITNGDAILRVALLFLTTIVIACVLAFLDASRRKRNVVAVMLTGLALGGVVYRVLFALAYGGGLSAGLGGWLLVAAAGAAVTAAGTALGAALAEQTWRQDP